MAVPLCLHVSMVSVKSRASRKTKYGVLVFLVGMNLSVASHRSRNLRLANHSQIVSMVGLHTCSRSSMPLLLCHTSGLHAHHIVYVVQMILIHILKLFAPSAAADETNGCAWHNHTHTSESDEKMSVGRFSVVLEEFQRCTTGTES